MEPTQMRDPIPDQLPPVIEAISDFIFVRDEPAPADLIFLPGSSHDEHVRKAAELCLAGYAPLILPSGLHGKLTGRFSGDPSYPSEFAFMRDLLISLGIQDEQILKEDRATFTWENALFSRQVTDRRGLRVDRAILCCRACHARRALFYYQSAFPDTDILVCPASVPGLNRDDWYQTEEGRHQVLGEVRRMGSQIVDILDALAEHREPPSQFN